MDAGLAALLGALLGGLVTLGASLITRRIQLQHLKVAEEGQITERFTRAIDQLGSDKLWIRLGGIYALERIARDSDEKDHWTVMEVLTAYVRDYKRDETSERIPLDVQAILTVIGRRERRYGAGEDKGLDLQGSDIRNANLNEAHLEEAILIYARLEKATLSYARLENANLIEARLENVNLIEAHLEKAYLSGAHLEKAILNRAHLEEANLMGAHLEKAYLSETHLEGATLFGAHLEGATLYRVHLEGADLTDVTGLTKEQIDSAITDETTKLPDYLKGPEQPEHGVQ